MQLLVDLNERDGTTVVAVLHDLALAAHFFPRIVVMDRGRIVADGPPAATLGRAADPRGLRRGPGARPPAGRARRERRRVAGRRGRASRPDGRRRRVRRGGRVPDAAPAGRAWRRGGRVVDGRGGVRARRRAASARSSALPMLLVGGARPGDRRGPGGRAPARHRDRGASTSTGSPTPPTRCWSPIRRAPRRPGRTRRSGPAGWSRSCWCSASTWPPWPRWRVAAGPAVGGHRVRRGGRRLADRRGRGRAGHGGRAPPDGSGRGSRTTSAADAVIAVARPRSSRASALVLAVARSARVGRGRGARRGRRPWLGARGLVAADRRARGQLDGDGLGAIGRAVVRGRRRRHRPRRAIRTTGSRADDGAAPDPGPRRHAERQEPVRARGDARAGAATAAPGSSRRRWPGDPELDDRIARHRARTAGRLADDRRRRRTSRRRIALDRAPTSRS